MATVVSRKRSDGTLAYRVKWVLGGARGGRWQSETFEDRRAALKFQAMVEANRHRWPDGWVKGSGSPPCKPMTSRTRRRSSTSLPTMYDV